MEILKLATVALARSQAPIERERQGHDSVWCGVLPDHGLCEEVMGIPQSIASNRSPSNQGFTMTGREALPHPKLMRYLYSDILIL